MAKHSGRWGYLLWIGQDALQFAEEQLRAHLLIKVPDPERELFRRELLDCLDQDLCKKQNKTKKNRYPLCQKQKNDVMWIHSPTRFLVCGSSTDLSSARFCFAVQLSHKRPQHITQPHPAPRTHQVDHELLRLKVFLHFHPDSIQLELLHPLLLLRRLLKHRLLRLLQRYLVPLQLLHLRVRRDRDVLARREQVLDVRAEQRRPRRIGSR